MRLSALCCAKSFVHRHPKTGILREFRLSIFGLDGTHLYILRFQNLGEDPCGIFIRIYGIFVSAGIKNGTFHKMFQGGGAAKKFHKKEDIAVGSHEGCFISFFILFSFFPRWTGMCSIPLVIADKKRKCTGQGGMFEQLTSKTGSQQDT